jgi:hypothetical protein
MERRVLESVLVVGKSIVSYHTVNHTPMHSNSPTQAFHRSLLGFLQGGFVPDTVLYLSYFYTKAERRYFLCF